MRVVPSHPCEREHTVTQEKSTQAGANLKALMAEDKDFLREIVRETMQQLLEVEMTDTLGAGPGERTEERLGYRAGDYPRTLITRVGKLELRVPRDRDGRFFTELFERYQRSETALVFALAEMYVQGVSTRKVSASSSMPVMNGCGKAGSSALRRSLSGSAQTRRDTARSWEWSLPAGRAKARGETSSWP